MLFIALFEVGWELKWAFVLLSRGKIYTLPESTPISVFRGHRVKALLVQSNFFRILFLPTAIYEQKVKQHSHKNVSDFLQVHNAESCQKCILRPTVLKDTF